MHWKDTVCSNLRTTHERSSPYMCEREPIERGHEKGVTFLSLVSDPEGGGGGGAATAAAAAADDDDDDDDDGQYKELQLIQNNAARIVRKHGPCHIALVLKPFKVCISSGHRVLSLSV